MFFNSRKFICNILIISIFSAIEHKKVHASILKNAGPFCPGNTVEYDDKGCSKQFGCWDAGNWNILPVLQLTYRENGRKNLNNTCIAECLDEISQALTDRESQESVKKIPKGRPDPKLYIFFSICYLVFC